MSEQLQELQRRLFAAKEQRGRLTEIAAGAGITYRTLYAVMQPDCKPSAATVDKLSAYFKKADKKLAKGGA